MYELNIIKLNGGNYIDSREVAELIGKRHDNLLRDITGYIKTLTKRGVLKIEDTSFFVESSYVDAWNRKKPCYLLSKLACELVANKLTGEKGVLFSACYVKRFNEMEAAERAEQAEPKAITVIHTPRLGEYNACARIIIRAMRDIGATPEQVIRFVKSIYEPLGISVTNDGDLSDTPRMYTAQQIAGMYGVYSFNGNLHAQAVSCIINENLLIGDKHKSVITTDYGGYTNISVRYDDYAAQAVREWLDENGYPNEIYGFERTFRVIYKD
jgi:Rha family phage regulatory protein